MICSLIRAVEINERFQENLAQLLIKTGRDEVVRMIRDRVVANILDCSYRLGGLMVTDMGNLEIFTGMQEVFHKTKMKMDEGTI